MKSDDAGVAPALSARHCVELLRLLGQAIAVGVFVSLVLGLAAFIVASTAHAAENDAPHGGELRFAQGPGEAPVPAPLLFTRVDIDVSGIVSRATVTQRFVNPGDDWREAVYVFPLPESAAVDHLQIRIGERRIEGQIRERAEARARYEQAKREGRKSALVEQERPNLFTASVAQIGPGEEVEVAIEYQQMLRYDQGAFSLRFPMAVTPRYTPGAPLPDPPSGMGFGPDTDRVPDASRITPPVVHPSHGAINPVAIAVHLQPGFALSRLESSYHPVDVEESAGHRYTVTLRDGPVPADRDFVLRWTPEVGAAPGAAVFVERKGERRYALVMVMPQASADVPRVAREITFVVDTSGSMAGTSIAQAKQALALALERLQPGDRFNVIEFNSGSRTLFPVPTPVDASTLRLARSFVSALKANGGTEMREALERALGAEASPGYVRQVVFLTDGAVGNEDELLSLIRERAGERRLFTVGIGSGPNSYFLTKAAQLGRGTFTFIGDVREVQERMGILFRKLESPVLTDISIAWPGEGEAWPARIPDLYAGEPVVVSAQLGFGDGDIELRGNVGGRIWHATLPMSAPADAPGIGVVWARAKIDALTERSLGRASADDVRREVVAVALEHHLVSRYTSLVAVDVTPSAPANAAIVKTAVPTNLPNGQQYEAIFGGLPQTATPAALWACIGLVLMAAALVLAYAQRRSALARVAPRMR